MKDGITQPPKKIDQIVPVEGCLEFVSPSKSAFGDEKNYGVVIKIIAGELRFFCSCCNKFNDQPSESCEHINMVMLKMVRTHIHNSAMFTAKKEAASMGLDVTFAKSLSASVVEDIADILDEFRNLNID